MARITEVELKPSWTWTCPKCGEKSIVEQVPAEINEEERLELIERLGDPWEFESREWFVHPEEVTCDKCETVFDVAIPDEDDDD